ncbi:hypothetical protein [Streptomyces sp. NPDC057509]
MKFAVFADGGKGKRLYGPVSSEAACLGAAKRYPGSKVMEVDKSARPIEK